MRINLFMSQLITVARFTEKSQLFLLFLSYDSFF